MRCGLDCNRQKGRKNNGTMDFDDNTKEKTICSSMNVGG